MSNNFIDPEEPGDVTTETEKLFYELYKADSQLELYNKEKIEKVGDFIKKEDEKYVLVDIELVNEIKENLSLYIEEQEKEQIENYYRIQIEQIIDNKINSENDTVKE